MDILIDFDGTCVRHEFPKVGEDIGAIPVLKDLVNKGHNLILFTMRCDHDYKPISTLPEIIAEAGTYLTDAIKWFEKNEIPLFGIQKNPTQHEWTNSPKAYGHFMIDDSAIGCPLKFDYGFDRPCVDWDIMRDLLERKGLL